MSGSSSKSFLGAAIGIALCLAGGGAGQAMAQHGALDYPPTRRESVTDTHFGTVVADPYRWLESPLADDPEVRDWVERQNKLTQAYLDQLPYRGAIGRRVAEIWNVEKFSAPQQRGERLFYFRNSGVQDQSAIYVQQGKSPPRLLLDPNTLGDGEDLVVQDWEPSGDGRRLLYTTQVNGGDVRTVRVLDVESGRTLDDEVTGLKAPQYAWLPDGSGYFYTAFDAASGGDQLTAAAATSAVFLHRIGERQSQDRLIYRDKGDQPLLHSPAISADGRRLVITSTYPSGVTAAVQVGDPRRPDAPLRTLIDGGQATWRFIGAKGERLYFTTSSNAPMGRVVALDADGSADQSPQVIVAEGGQPIRQAMFADDELIVRYLDVAQTVIRRFAADGRANGEIPLPALAVADQLSGRPGDPALFFLASTMSRPATLYRFDLASGASSMVHAPEVAWDPDDYVIRQVFATSRDGTKIPVTFAHRRDLDLSAGAPTAIMAYGGWGLSPGLEFYESRFAWMDLGGVFAIAHTRGGAEYGKAWYETARKGGRVLTFEDYIAATELLQTQGVTTPAKTVAIGASNGGILVAAAANLRPDLYSVVLPRVPVTDMVRYTRFTLGRMWTEELGDPDKPDEFQMLLGYSPLHNIRNGAAYPSILVTTADTDDRVVPAHSFKYVAALQAADIGPRPHLLRVEFGAGHGQGKTQGKLIEEFSDLWAFAAAGTGMKPILEDAP